MRVTSILVAVGVPDKNMPLSVVLTREWIKGHYQWVTPILSNVSLYCANYLIAFE